MALTNDSVFLVHSVPRDRAFIVKVVLGPDRQETFLIGECTSKGPFCWDGAGGFPLDGWTAESRGFPCLSYVSYLRS
jgi:hypothetical protein